MDNETVKSKLIYKMFRALFQKEKIEDKDEFICNFMDELDKLDVVTEGNQEINIADELIEQSKPNGIIDILQ